MTPGDLVLPRRPVIGGLVLAQVHLAMPMTDAYTVHQAVAASTSGQRVLWAAPTPSLLIVQAEQVVWRGPATTGIPDVFAVRRWRDGDRVMFGLIAAPTSGVGRLRPDGTPSDRKGRRRLPVGEHADWLTRKLGSAAQITELTVTPKSAAVGCRPGTRSRITITRSLFTGAATVTDADVLAGLVSLGVGTGKAFGCGLLLLKEAR